MSWNVIQSDNGSVKIVPQGCGSETKEVIIEFAPGVYIGFGRGVTDTDITYIVSKNADGDACFIYGNAAQNAITVSGTTP